jgi:osmoprotectant transport system permease protein
MTYFWDGIVWLNDPLNWTNPGGMLDRLEEHMVISLWAVLLGCAVGWPVGIWLGHRGRGGGAVITVANLTLAIPTLALLTILPLTALGFGKPPVVVALAVFAVPPLLANAYTGLRQIDPETRSSCRSRCRTWRPGCGPQQCRWWPLRRSPRSSTAAVSARSSAPASASA